MTMPSLIANYQKKVWTAQLKKTYSTLNEAYRQTLAHAGCTDAISCGFMDVGSSILPVFSTDFYIKLLNNLKHENLLLVPNINNMTSEELNDFSANVNQELGNYYTTLTFKLMKNNRQVDLYDLIPSYYVEKGGFFANTTDGAMIAFFNSIYILIDVNGSKGPNVIGRDVFMFSATDNAIVPESSIAYRNFLSRIYPKAADESGLSDTLPDYNELKSKCLSSTSASTSAISCADIIVFDGWEMKY